jgi:hypothetical protein
LWKSYKLLTSVFVETFSNEFVSQAFDFFSDSTVEINSFIQGAGINGVITDFPKSAHRYTSARKLYCTIDRSLIGPDTIEGDVLVGFKNEKPKVWRVYTRKKKENSVGNMRVVSC